MSAQHFSCTKCGKCCYGWIPLTIVDALAHAHRFPLVVMMTPVRQGNKSYETTKRTGLVLQISRSKALAIRIAPLAYIPPSMPCPALADDNLCSIHDDKPARCRAMPFSPIFAEADQAPLLKPKSGWECDTSDSAPIVYQDHKIIGWDGYDQERALIEQDAAVLRKYGQWMLDTMPDVKLQIEKAATQKWGGYVLLNFTTLIARLPNVDMFDFAERQLPVLRAFAERTSGHHELLNYHEHYLAAGAHLTGLLRARPA